MPVSASLGSALALFVLLVCFANAGPSAPALAARADATVYYAVDDMSGPTFFDHWDFWSEPDPTHGFVNYTGVDDAWHRGLVYIGLDDGLPAMRADGWTSLPYGTYRHSVRIQTKKTYSGGLFIFDLAEMPWGCALWPAIWSYGPSWPDNGEIDIVEGVNLQKINQMVIHAGEGCYLTNPGTFTGTALSTNRGPSSGGSGCQIEDRANDRAWGRAFNEAGGGVFAMLWDGNGIQIWSWTVGSVPADIDERRPNPTTWGRPAGAWSAASCDPYRHFKEHSLVINLSICGDWAGGDSYASSGCGTDCAAQVMDPAHFQTARFRIRSVRTYTAAGLSDQVNGLDVTRGHGGKASSSARDHQGRLWLSLVIVSCMWGLA